MSKHLIDKQPIRELLHDTTTSYAEVDYHGIEYTVCKEFPHISRYKRLRQVIHYLEGTARFKTLELQNSYDYDNLDIEYYEVSVATENRLDLISYKYFGTTSYSWIIAYINGIHDGFTVSEGQILMIPTKLSDLFTAGCVLSAISPTSLNLGTE